MDTRLRDSHSRGRLATGVEFYEESWERCGTRGEYYSGKG